MNIILLGPPGTGKGVEGRRISEKYNLGYFSSGDYFRDKMKENTDLGREIKKYVDNGKLIPDNLTIRVLREEILLRYDGVVLDGFPRTIKQAETLEKSNFKIDYVIFVDSSEDIIVHRAKTRRICSECKDVYNIETKKPKKENICDKCGGELIFRADDQDEKKIRHRLQDYENETKPLINFYKKKNLLYRVDGDPEIDKVVETICKIFDK